jgi:hypothetical protein
MDNNLNRSDIDVTPPNWIAPVADITHAEMECAWFRHFDNLGLAPERIMHEVTADGKIYYPHFWLANWNSFVYVLPERNKWDAADQATFDEAYNLMDTIRAFDVIVTIGTPATHTTHNLILFSYVLMRWFEQNERTPLIDVEWTLAGIFDLKNNNGILWLLFNDVGADVYMPQEQQWCQTCVCKKPDCDDCADFRVFYPVVAIEVVNTDPFVGKEPQRSRKRPPGNYRPF